VVAVITEAEFCLFDAPEEYSCETSLALRPRLYIRTSSMMPFTGTPPLSPIFTALEFVVILPDALVEEISLLSI
jgi:hypothetical protein